MSRIASGKQLQQRENACVVKKKVRKVSPRKFLRNLRFLQILTQGNVVHRGRLFYLTATIFSRDPFDQVVKESGSNPDVVGSNPTTSRFFAPRGILCVDKIGPPAIQGWKIVGEKL